MLRYCVNAQLHLTLDKFLVSSVILSSTISSYHGCQSFQIRLIDFGVWRCPKSQVYAFNAQTALNTICCMKMSHEGSIYRKWCHGCHRKNSKNSYLNSSINEITKIGIIRTKIQNLTMLPLYS